MKAILFILFLYINSICFSQSIVTRRTLTSSIKVTIPIGWQKVDDDISTNIRPNLNMYNIISIYKGGISENIITLYGDSVVSKIIISNALMQSLRDRIEKKVLPQLTKISKSDLPFDRVLSILEKFYKDNPEKYKNAQINKEEVLSKAKINTDKPSVISFQGDGFYYLLPVSISFDNFSYSFSLIMGQIRLNKYTYGISGSFENLNKSDIEKFIKNIISQNPS